MTMFRTLDATAHGIVLYQLSIRDPSQAYADLATYTFPISPSSIRYEPSALSTYADTQGSPLQNGVSRIVDTYGLSPPMITIEGTTGFDRHSADGYVLDGRQSMLLLKNFIEQYTALNEIQKQAGNYNLLALEFSDYFTSNFWQCQPVGPQIIRQSAERPALLFYRFRLAAMRPVRLTAVGVEDALLHLLNVPILQAVASAAQSANTMLAVYGPAGITAALA